MSAALLFLFLSGAPPLSGPLAGAEQPVFSRPEPNLLAGAAHLRQGDAQGALESFRKATGKSANERAIIEFDVGQALLVQAQQDAQAAPEADGGAQKIDVADARAAFERAFGLAADPGLKSEAQLASGNAAALGGDLEGAISSYRKALVADPKNERAKKNLLRVLAAKKQQPPPPPSEGGEDDENDEDKKDDKQEEKPDPQKEQEPKDGKSGEDDKKKEGDDKQPQDGQGGEDDKKQDPQKKPDSGDQQDEQDKKQPGQGAAQPQPKTQKKEDAKKLLDALRSREKPLSPLEMRGTAKNRPKTGKDW